MARTFTSDSSFSNFTSIESPESSPRSTCHPSFGDAEAERRVLAAEHPAEAKKAGRLVRGFDGAIWERERFRIVVGGSVHKFAAHDDLRAFLLNTGDRVLVEASPVDRVWGIGLAAGDEAARDPERWRGPNLLGFALMEARERLAGSGA